MFNDLQSFDQSQYTKSKYLNHMEFRDIKIGGKYIVGPKIGSGSFGQVYLVNVYGTNEIYALKKEDQRSKHLQLMTEARILKSLQGANGFAQIYYQGNQNRSNLMITDLLGPTLEDLYLMCGKKFSLKTTLILADQLLQRIEWLHSKNYIHRDIKPENFLVGLSKKSHIIHLIDFGLSKKYRDLKTHQHTPYKENKNLTGTARYASINAHLGIEQSRRDDLEAIGYVLLYFVQGFLPWQGIRANNKLQKYQKIMQKKMSIPVQIQCRGLPIQFSIYLNYCRSLKFQDKPDYIFLRRLFRELMEREGYKMDFDYDWCNLEGEREIENCKVKIEIKKPICPQIQEEQEEQNISSNDQQQDLTQQKQANNSVNKPVNKSVNKSQSQYKRNNDSNYLQADDVDMQIKSGEQNIDDDDIMDESEFNLQVKNQNRAPDMDMEEKKNRMLYDD